MSANIEVRHNAAQDVVGGVADRVARATQAGPQELVRCGGDDERNLLSGMWTVRPTVMAWLQSTSKSTVTSLASTLPRWK
jgi:hypothetical protein